MNDGVGVYVKRGTTVFSDEIVSRSVPRHRIDVTLAGFSVGYDRAGLKIYEQHLHEGGSGELYRYDSLNRLTAASLDVPDVEQYSGDQVPAVFGRNISFALDPVHNWSSREERSDPADASRVKAQAFTANALNQYASLTTTVDSGPAELKSFIYDEAGNLLDDGR